MLIFYLCVSLIFYCTVMTFLVSFSSCNFIVIIIYNCTNHYFLLSIWILSAWLLSLLFFALSFSGKQHYAGEHNQSPWFWHHGDKWSHSFHRQRLVSRRYNFTAPFQPLICQKRLSNCFKYKPRLTPCVLHSDIPVGSQDFHMLLKRLVSYMQLKVRRRFWPGLHVKVDVCAVLLIFFFNIHKELFFVFFLISVHFRVQISRNPSYIYK